MENKQSQTQEPPRSMARDFFKGTAIGAAVSVTIDVIAPVFLRQPFTPLRSLKRAFLTVPGLLSTAGWGIAWGAIDVGIAAVLGKYKTPETPAMPVPAATQAAPQGAAAHADIQNGFQAKIDAERAQAQTAQLQI